MKKIILLLCILCSSLLFSGCYSWYESKIDMDTKTPKINLNDLLYKEKEITSLEPPKQIIVSQGRYNNVIKIHWDEVPYATSYRIERAVVVPDAEGNISSIPEEGDFEVICKYVYSNNYTDTILSYPSHSNKEYNYRYYYRISAENIKDGLESSDFTPVTMSACGWLLNPPASIDAQKGDSVDSILVKWSPVPYANRYLIYRGEKENGLGMEELDSVMGNKNQYTNVLSANEQGVEFYYKVCAVLADGSKSAFTGLALGYSANADAPSYPESVVVTNGNAESVDKLTISWPAVSSTGYTIKYSVYRTSSESSIFELISNNVSSTSDPVTLQDSSAKPGVKYYYYVQTVAADSAEPPNIFKSAFSKTGPTQTVNGVEVPNDKAAEGWLLSPPSNCEVTDSTDPSKAVLRWTPAIGYETVDYIYNIYFSNSVDGDYSLLESGISEASGEILLAEDGYYNFEIDKKNFYRISTTKMNSELESILGAAVAPSPAAPENVTASKTSSLGGLGNYTPNTNGVYPVLITWSAPANENPYGYHVYRSTKPNSSFRKITDEPVTDGSCRFIDENETARAGSFYYYKVVSLNELKQGKNSNVQNENSKGYGAITRDQWFREYNKTVKKSLSKLTLMHKSGTNALGSESINGDISGSLSYNAKMEGLGARIFMHYTNYVDFYINNDASLGPYFFLNGDTNTSANMSANGSMDGTNQADKRGMYPGYAKYDNLEIKGGSAGGGYYIVCTQDKNGNTVLGEGKVDWTVGEE